MKPLLFRQALEEIRRQLKALSQTVSAENMVIGVAGYVASGKSRLCNILRADIETLLHRPVIYLPFDLWINRATRYDATYAGRFFLPDLIAALRCIRAGERFLVPRYDIIRTSGVQVAESQVAVQQLLWNGKNFIRCSQHYNGRRLFGSTETYIESQSGYVYSLFPATSGQVFVIDGTLIFPESTADLYNLRIFVRATWTLRVARMIRRFNRKEVFGETSKPMRDYVGFLVDEARACADEEISGQVNDDMLVVESIPDTLSNYLDLAYMRWLIGQPDAPQWVTQEEVDISMQEFVRSLKDEHDTKTLESHRQELLALMESKHLLALHEVDTLLTELASIIL